tara:strand:- start:443 stop:739 length:297 start_codon:yes stop_codon:yes gene_type:complete
MSIAIGDLICFNAAGMKSQSLGLVMDIRTRDTNGYGEPLKGGQFTSVKIRWIQKPPKMPAVDSWSLHSMEGLSWAERTYADTLWHKLFSSFEKVKLSP